MKEKDIKAEIRRLQSKINGNPDQDHETLEQIEVLNRILNKTDGKKSSKEKND